MTTVIHCSKHSSSVITSSMSAHCDTHSGIKHPLRTLADDINLCGAANMPERWEAIRGHLHRHEQRAQENLMRLNKFKCKVLHMSHSNLGCHETI